MEKAVHNRPVSEEDEAFSSSKIPRLEASPSSGDIEKDTEYKLPLYLSEFALWVFNSKKNADYEKVNVVKTMKSLDVIEVNFVRMEPSGFDYNGEHESEEKVSESKEEGLEEKVTAESDEKDTGEKLAVRKTVGGKGPKQHPKYSEEIDVSESKEEGSEEDISEDSEEEFSEESDEEDNEEMPSKSDEKDTVTYDQKFGQRNIVSRKTVGGKAPRVQMVFSGRWTYYDPPIKNISNASLIYLVNLCQLAICVYNMKEVTNYDNVKVLKTMQSPCAARIPTLQLSDYSR
ncbi:hypothetical protein POM88_052456 [Heracleum sosnowskyi]|uniref:Uncharacterized protein n=1 Tax=Heracleum sosnowskyi TaxID=360622 RepID=A0AAD8GSM1_9APIA|nr:hypothetical protein POM88_052456 [Heracleum sosnowskyi]